jgi:hypothetical protein
MPHVLNDSDLTCYDAVMKRANANAAENKAKPVKAGARSALPRAKVVAAKPSYSKAARQAAFKQEVAILHLSPVEAVDRARLIPSVDVKAFRIIHMPS